MADLRDRSGEHWVVGVDGSSGSDHALRWAISQAADRPVTIRAIRAAEPLAAAEESTLPLPTDESSSAVEEFATRQGMSSAIEWTVEFGPATSTLLDAADAAHLLVMGTRGMGGFKRLLLGSVSQQCATHATAPVAVIPATAALAPVERLVVGMDGSDNAKAALRWALRFARPGQTVRVIGAWEPSVLATDADRADFDDLSASTRERFTAAVEDVTGSAGRDDVTLETSFHHAKATTALLDEATADDLLVVGSRGHGWAGSTMLGSVSNSVLHHAVGPVVVVPDPSA